MTNEELKISIDELRASMDQRFDRMDQKIDNLTTLQEETMVEVGAVKTRLGDVESTVNRIASKVGVASIPAMGGSGRSPASLSAKRK